MFTVKNNKYAWPLRLAMFAATFLVMFGLVFGAKTFINTRDVVAASISLDVNPSVEIKINKDEKVIEVVALNEDAKKVIGDMDFTGSDLKLTVNALIGSMVRNGYINELTNSILVSVDDSNAEMASQLEEKLMNEISTLIDEGSVMAQQVNADEGVKQIAETYGITLGKAQLIKELSDKTTIYTYEELAGLTINELNLLSRNLNESQVQRNGQPSDKAYIGEEKAKEIALADAGVSADQVFVEKVELDYEFKTMIYEVDFVYNGTEYEYVLNAETGEVIYVDVENDRTYSSGNTPAPTPAPQAPVSNNSNVIDEAKAKQIALANAGVSESEITGFRIHREYDDGIVKYEIDFYVGNVEYDYDINAYTGDVIKAEKDLENDYVPSSGSNTSGTYRDDDDQYKVENGKVYEYDDGRWEYEEDKKVENGKVYEYDDGRWEQDDDRDDDWDDDRDDDWDDDDDDRYDRDDD